MDQWMRDFEERQRHDELKQKNGCSNLCYELSSNSTSKTK